MLGRRDFLVAAAAGAIGLNAEAAEPRIRNVRTIASLPQSSAELKALHDSAAGFAAELLPEEQPYEIKSFVPYLTQNDERDAGQRRPDPCCRRHALSVGLEMLSDDQKQLPTLSGGQILAYLKDHFVSVQTRIYREPISRMLYLGTRCLAATRKFHGATLTQVFSPTVAESVSNMRSLGLLLPARTTPTPSNLRTLVLVHKNQLSVDNKRANGGKTNYEYLFIRAHESGPDQLKLHAFATSDERTKFHWLKPAASPVIPADCSVRGAVHFTEYSHQGLYPKSAIIRRSLISAQRTFSWDAVEKYAKTSFGQPAMESITQILDAVIAGKLMQYDR
jgi:hypothetical protein